MTRVTHRWVHMVALQSFKLLALVVTDEARAERLRAECCPTCRSVTPLARFRPADELWCVCPWADDRPSCPRWPGCGLTANTVRRVLECEATLGSQVAALLPEDVPSFRTLAGEVSFVVRKDVVGPIAHMPNVTFVPVPRQSVVRPEPPFESGGGPRSPRDVVRAIKVIPDFLGNPIEAKFAPGGTVQSEPAVGKLVADVKTELVEKHVVHLSNYFTRLSTSGDGTRASPSQKMVTLQTHSASDAQPWKRRNGSLNTLPLSVYAPFSPCASSSHDGATHALAGQT